MQGNPFNEDAVLDVFCCEGGSEEQLKSLGSFLSVGADVLFYTAEPAAEKAVAIIAKEAPACDRVIPLGIAPLPNVHALYFRMEVRRIILGTHGIEEANRVVVIAMKMATCYVVVTTFFPQHRESIGNVRFFEPCRGIRATRGGIEKVRMYPASAMC